MSNVKNTFAENKFLTVLQRLKEKLAKQAGDEDDETFQDYGIGDEDLEGLTVTDDPFDDEDDEASAWLKQQEGDSHRAPGSEDPDVDEEDRTPEEEAVPKRLGSFKEWEPHGEYTDEHHAKMKEHMDQGYSHREAERLAGAHKGPTDFQSALRHNIWPSQPSGVHLGELQEIARHWNSNKDRLEKLEADPEKSPLKHAAGQALRAHEEASKDYKESYGKFLSSVDEQGLKGRQRFKAIQEWKNNWKQENPDHHEKLANLDIHQHFREAGAVGGGRLAADPQREVKTGRHGRMGETIDDRIERIAGVGAVDTVSAEEAAQHVGGTKTEAGTQAGQMRDPLATGMIHPKQRELAQKERMDRAHKILQQHGQPDQVKRFVKLRSAKRMTDPATAAPAKPTGGSEEPQ
jgi:hypothetical protein